MNFRACCSAGFTALELMVGVSMVATLVAVSVPVFEEYKTDAYCSTADQATKFGVLAMEEGKNRHAEDWSSMQWLWQTTPGTPSTPMGQELAPGFQVPAGSQVYLYHDPSCADSWCLEDYAFVRNCKVDRYSYYYRTSGGFTWQVSCIPAGWGGC